MTTTRVEGLDQLLATLKRLPEKVGKRAVMNSLMAGGRVVRDEARSRAPVLDTSGDGPPPRYRKKGTVKRAIVVLHSKINKGKTGVWEVIVRVKPLKKSLRSAKNPDDPYYWWWLEFGTAKMAARPFMRPAFAATHGKQLSVIRARFDRELGAAVLEARRGT